MYINAKSNILRHKVYSNRALTLTFVLTFGRNTLITRASFTRDVSINAGVEILIGSGQIHSVNAGTLMRHNLQELVDIIQKKQSCDNPQMLSHVGLVECTEINNYNNRLVIDYFLCILINQNAMGHFSFSHFIEG